jgi:hypothetical protein
MGDRAHIFEALIELYKPRTVDEKARCARSRVRSTWRWKVNRLGFGCRGAATNVHLKTKLEKGIKDGVGALDAVITRVEEERVIVREEGGPEPLPRAQRAWRPACGSNSRPW